MTARDDLAALIQRVEAAEGPSRELDHAISMALSPCNAMMDARACPRYTASLDAAASLVPDGAFWIVSRSSYETRRYVEIPTAAAVVGSIRSDAATPALALCAAALRARQAMEARDE